MNREQFMNDLQLIYNELQTRQKELNSYYDLVDESKTHKKAEDVVDAFLTLIDIPKTKESQMASLGRIINLREDSLEQILKKNNCLDEEIVIKKELAYGFASSLHINRHESFIKWVEDKNLLTPFYRSLMLGLHYVGIALSTWQSYWTDHIINNVNKELSKRFDGDDSKVFEFLTANHLLDLDHNGNIADRCYSVLVKDEKGDYKSVAYVNAFPKEVKEVIIAFEQMISLLQQSEDEVFDQKEEWLVYFNAIKEAFSHTVPNELVAKWANVDRAWMSVKTPLQVGHPLEYYEDHYRKAVALEWDLRIINPKLQEGSPTRENIKKFASLMADGLGEKAKVTIEKNLKQVDETQLYIGQPILYYGAEFNGLFSAQVVPNDEEVSVELGKKIFAYADFVMESKKAKPIMKLGVEIFGKEFIESQKELINSNPKLWQEMYDISTVGHEYGHILWIDGDTESKMNESGQFKNIEEFKATAGGLMAFFVNEKEELKKELINDVVTRSIGLMAWREVGEVLPYYCEGLIHLDILFKSGVISYKDKITINYEKYDEMKKFYQEAYLNLAKHYLSKLDAEEYLTSYALKKEGVYLPKDKNINSFVELYYLRYKEIGQQTLN